MRLALLLLAACTSSEPAPVVHRLPTAAAPVALKTAHVVAVSATGALALDGKPLASAQAVVDAIPSPMVREDDPQLAREQAIEAGILDNGMYEGELPVAAAIPAGGIRVEAVPGAPAKRIVELALLTPIAIAVEGGVMKDGFRARYRTQAGRKWAERAADGTTLAANGELAPQSVQADLRLDLLVDDRMTAQQLVEQIDAARAAGWSDVGIALSNDTAAARKAAVAAARGPRLVLGQPNAQGDLPKKDIRAVVAAHVDELRACFPGDANLTASFGFVIDATGKVIVAQPFDKAAPIAACAVPIFKAMVFPKPKGGGIVQVNYPLVFHKGD